MEADLPKDTVELMHRKMSIKLNLLEGMMNINYRPQEVSQRTEDTVPRGLS